MEAAPSHRTFFAELVTSSAGAAKNDRLREAFATTPRENFVGPGPWKIFAGGNLVDTPTNDPAFLYQDVVVALAPERHINNGQPVLHAMCLAALNIRPGESIAHIGAGTGYYTAILAKLTGPTGSVTAYEIEPDLATRAAANLSYASNVTVENRNAAEGALPRCDVIYVSAGATAPLDTWLDALRPDGRLLFPLTSSDGPGGAPGPGAMLLIARPQDAAPDAPPSPTDIFAARFLSAAVFIHCVGARDEATAAKLADAFKRGDARNVRSLHRYTAPDASSWCAGEAWWLSTSSPK
jgi:protein-L-isoaspartate(D-aspartate) O-methyltransferase